MKKILLVLVYFFASFPAFAQVTAGGVAPLETLAKQAIVVEAATGNVLYAKEADAQMPTSSMSKVLTMYLVFDAIKNGKLAIDQMITISDNAWRQTGSRMFVNVGDQVKVEDLIRGVIIQSGNDAAVALAEAVAGTEASFAELMNAKAKELGMNNSHFKNATGLPDPEHYSTARDLTTLAMSLMRDYPQHYHYYGETEFTYNKIKQGNRNPLLYRNMGVDGMKTGHTDSAGYGLIASALRENRRIVTVVNGLSSMQERADEPAKLIEWAYREYGLYTMVEQGKVMGEAKLWLGEASTVPVAAEKTIVLSLPRAAKETAKVEATVANPEFVAPIQKGQVLGKVVISGANIPTQEVALIATDDVKQLGIFARTIAKIKRAIGRE